MRLILRLPASTRATNQHYLPVRSRRVRPTHVNHTGRRKFNDSLSVLRLKRFPQQPTTRHRRSLHPNINVTTMSRSLRYTKRLPPPHPVLISVSHPKRRKNTTREITTSVRHQSAYLEHYGAPEFKGCTASSKNHSI